MRLPSPLSRPLASAAVGGCLFLQGCTAMLWSGLDKEFQLPLEVVTVPCQVHEVRSPQAGNEELNEILVRFSAVRTAGSPAHLDQHPRSGGWLALQGAEAWRDVPGAHLFEPTSWDLRVTNGSYFVRRGANARVTFRGFLTPRTVGSMLLPAQVAPALRECSVAIDPALAHGDEARCLQALAANDWFALFSRERTHARYSTTPVAWLDPDGKPLATPPFAGTSPGNEYRPPRDDLEECELLARVDNAYGDLHYLRIPVGILLQGKGLKLRRIGERVEWEVRRICPAELLAQSTHLGPAALSKRLARLSPLDVPLLNSRFDYRWAREVPPSTNAFDYIWRAIVTPITAVIDVAVLTNPYLYRLYLYVTGQDGPRRKEPGRGR